MVEESAEEHAMDLMRRVDAQIHERAALIEQAAQVLLERYNLPADQALVFLEQKGREDDRDPSAVAWEILKGRDRSDAP